MKTTKFLSRLLAVVGLLTVLMTFGLADNECSDIAPTTHQFTETGSGASYSHSWADLDESVSKYYYFNTPSNGFLTITYNTNTNVVYRYSLDSCPTGAIGTVLSSGSTISLDADNDFNLRILSNADNQSTNFNLTFTSTEQPEIDVVGVADDGADATSYGGTSVGSSIDRTYTIKNTGGATLNLGAFSMTGDFIVITSPAASVPAGGTTTFTVRFAPTATGNRTGTVSFVNNDSSENPYNFTVTGTGTAPEAKVLGNGREIVDGDTSPVTSDYSYLGSVALGNSQERTYMIQNTGSASLNVGSVTLSGGTGASYFTVTAQPASTVAPNSSTSFNVKYTASVTGVYTTDLSFTTNDSDENPYNFKIRGSDIAPEAKVKGNNIEIADGDNTPTTGDFTDFGNVKAGASSENTYIIYNTGTSALSVENVSIGGADAGSFSVTLQPATSVIAGKNTQFTVKYSPSSALAANTVHNATISFVNNDANENPYNFAIKATGVIPEIDVKGDSNSIVDGDITPTTTDFTDFGNVTMGSPSTKRYYIYNTGTATLNVSTPTISGANASDYNITINPSATVLAGENTYFDVTFTPSVDGVRNAEVSFVNDDPNENPYDFTIKGAGATPEIDVKGDSVSIVDGDTTPTTTDFTDFGNVVLGAYVDKIFYIYNAGRGTLTVGALTLPTGFSIQGAMPTSVGAESNASFTVRYRPTAVGATSGTLSFVNSDSDENPYDFTIAGNARQVLANEGSPLESAKLVEGVCDIFADMFQTHLACGGGGGSSTVNFNDNAKTLDGSKNYILNNIDNKLNTCDVTARPQVLSGFETCGVPGDCEETGTPAVSLNLDYSNTPTLDTISTSPSSSTTDKTLSAEATYNEGIDYRTLSVANNNDYKTFKFEVDHQLKVNTITFMNDDKISFTTTTTNNPYSLDIGKINFTGSGVNNDIYANDRFAKNIKVGSISLSGLSQIYFEAKQTIKIGSLKIADSSSGDSTIWLKAPYVQLGTLEYNKNSTGTTKIIIIADHVDIGSLDLRKNSTGSVLDLEIWPYSPKPNVLFRANSINESNSPRMYLSQGAYYTGTWTTSGDASGVPVAQAIDATAMIDFYVNSNLFFGSQSGINTAGAKNYGSNPALNFKLFVNGNVTFGGGDNTINATMYTTGSFTSNHDTYIRGAVSASKVDVYGGQYTYDQGINASSWGACSVPPKAVDDNVTTEQNKPINIPILANDTGDGIKLLSKTNPSHGTLKVETNGTITYTPTNRYVGSDTFTYTIKDTGNQTDIGEVNIKVEMPLPQNEEIPALDIAEFRGECVFPDMFQTHTTCGTTKVNFSVPANPIDGSNHYIVENEDRRLYTCGIEASSAVTSSYQTCGARGNCVAVGKPADALSGFSYSNAPVADTISSAPASGANLSLTTSQTLSGYDYDTLTANATSVTTDFNVTRRLSINTLVANKASTFNFTGTEPYALHIGTISSTDIKSTLTTDTNAKNIKINKIQWKKQGNTINLKAQQTIKISSLETYQFTSVTLEAPYVQLGTLIAYDRTQITIKANVVDIGTLLLFHGSDEGNASLTTLKIEPYTSGREVIFRSNGVTQEHNMQLLLSTGDYYMRGWSTTGDSVGTSVAKAVDASSVVNLIVNSGVTFNKNASLNANGIKDFGSNPPAKLRLFANGAITFGDGTNTLNATLYASIFTSTANTYVKGAISTGGDITLNGGQYFYDQTGNEVWKVCQDPLEATDDNVTTRKNLSKTIDVLINDISYCEVSSPYANTFPIATAQGGTVSLLAVDNTLSYTPPADFEGIDTFDYTIKDKKTCTDANPITDTAKVTIKVVEVVANDDNRTVESNTTIDIAVRDNDTGEGIEVTSYTQIEPKCGSTEIIGAKPNTIRYIPVKDCEGKVMKFQYTITDAYGYTDDATVYVTVTEPVFKNTDDLCYEEPKTEGAFCVDIGTCSGGLGCKNSFPIKNIGNASLEKVKVVFDEVKLGFSLYGNCGVDPTGFCTKESNLSFGSFGTFGSTTVYDFKNVTIPVGNNSNKFWMRSFVGFGCFTANDIYTSYRKGTELHQGRLSPCVTELEAKEGYREFELRKQIFAKGDMRTIGNTVLVPPQGSDAENKCNTYINEPFISDATLKNEDYYLCGYHSDATNAALLSNSTQSLLDIPNDAVVVWAGLYWQGIVEGGIDPNMSVKLRQDGSGYVNVPVQVLDYVSPTIYKTPSGGATSTYAAFADVTAYFGKDRWNKGTYTVANVPTYEGKIEHLGSYGAWSLVFIYEDEENPNEKYRSFSVYDGWKIVSSDQGKVPVVVKDFFTPNRPNINAKTSVFVAEGDKKIDGDLFKTKNYNSGATVFLGSESNAFDSSINGGSDRGPQLVNNNGIDIKTYDLGAYMAPKQSEMEFIFTSELDVYWPSMLAFSTEVYMPKLCYDYTIKIGDYITVPSEGREFDIGSWDGGDPLVISTLIRSQESDFNLISTSMWLKFDHAGEIFFDTAKPQVVAPPGVNAYLSAEILDSSKGQVAIGALPWNGGGVIGATESTYAKLSYDLERNATRPVMSFDVKVSTVLSLPGVTIPVELTTATGVGNDGYIDKCPANPIYDPIIGTFNIENSSYDNFSAPASKRYPLFTQIAGRPYSVYIRSYGGKKFDQEQAISNTTVEIEIIDAGTFDNNSTAGYDSKCEEPTSFGDGAMKYFNNVSQVKVDIPTDFKGYATNDTALRNAAFRLWMLTKLDQNGTRAIVPHNCTDKTDEECFRTVYNNNYATMDATSKYCKDNCSASGSGCYACLKRYFAYPVCSRDNFAIRPHGFRVEVRDSNETTGVAPSVLITNNNANTTRQPISAGYNYLLDINATSSNGMPSKGYYSDGFIANRANEINTTDTTVALLQFDGSLSCSDQSDQSYGIKFLNSKIRNSNNTLSYNNVGDYRFWMQDVDWTYVDQARNLNKTIFDPNCRTNIKDSECNDCILSSSNGVSVEPGCVISSKVDNDNAYTDIPLQIQPFAFNVSSVVMDQSTGVGFAYTADINTTNLLWLAQSPHFGGNVIAINRLGGSVSNFASGCASSDVFFDINRTMRFDRELAGDLNITTITPNLFIGGNVFMQRNAFEQNASSNYDAVSPNDINLTFTIGRGDFDTNGTAPANVYYNFQKNLRNTHSPIDVTFVASRVTSPNAHSNTFMRSDYVPEGTSALANARVWYYYGRIVSKEANYGVEPSQNSITVPIYVEVYCDPLTSDCASSGLILQSERDADRWWINTRHNSATHGLMQSIDEVPGGSITIAPNSTVNLGNDGNQTNITLTLGGSTIKPYNSVIQITPNMPWLFYNPFSTDGSNRPDFSIVFLFGGGWGGLGNTGVVLDTNASYDSYRKRIEW